MKPAPATASDSQRSPASICATIFSARTGAEVFLCPRATSPTGRRLQLRAIAKDRQNFLRGFRGGQTLAHGPVVQELCNGSKRTQMRLKLIFRHDEKDDEFHRSIIER